MDSKLKPVPAFYCCYLLRSTIRHSSLYIGSSPHPARRLAQHNGKVKGGAVRTSRLSLRPWEMVCVVAGFPSNIAALQFEWAWHNPHLTKHISPEERLSLPTARTKTNAKTGKKRRRPGRPRTSLIDKLSNLHLLLRAPYFSKWPLELRFWSADVHKSWIAWTGRASEQVRLETKVLLDMPQQHEEQELARSQKLTQRRKTELFGSGGVEGVDPTSAKFQPVLRKLHILENDDDDSIPLCGVCGKDIDADKDLFNICLAENCHCLTHLSCLSARFLKQGTSNALVPSSGTCPSCRTTLIWIDLMRVLSLRTRADKEVKRLLKKKTHGTAATAEELLEDSDNSALEDDDDPEEHALEDASDDDMNSDSDDAASITSVDSRSMPSKPSKAAAGTSQPQRLEIVIEDSEDER